MIDIAHSSIKRQVESFGTCDKTQLEQKRNQGGKSGEEGVGQRRVEQGNIWTHTLLYPRKHPFLKRFFVIGGTFDS